MARGTLLDVGHRQSQQLDDVLVVERVEDLTASPARTDQPHPSEKAQLVRHGRLADAHERRNVTDAQLTAGERVEDADACGVPENAESGGDLLNSPRRQELGFPGGGVVGVEVRDVAVFRHMNI